MALFFLPTFLLPIIFVLFFIKKISNDTIGLLMGIGFFGPILIINRLLDVQNDTFGTGEFIFTMIFMLVLNGIPYSLMLILLRRKRCPRCNYFGVKTLSKDVAQHTVNTLSKYEYSNKPGVYSRISSRTNRTITYHLYCPECAHRFEDYDNETLHSQGREKRIQ